MSFIDNMIDSVAPAILDALGESAVYTPSGGAAVACTVDIVHNVMLQPSGIETQVWQRGTTIEALLDEIGVEPGRGDTFVVREQTYTVQAVMENDGVTVKVVVT